MATNREVLCLLRSMRIEVDGAVDDAVRALVRGWSVAWDELAREWEGALTELVKASTDGAWPSRSQIVRAERAMRALDATRTSLDVLSQRAGVQIMQGAPEMTAAAAEWEARLTAAQMPAQAGTQSALTATFNRVDPSALEAIVTRTTGQVTSLLLPLSTQATQAMTASLIRGVALGDNPRTTARLMLKRVEGGFNGGLTRAMTIARTETLDAHRTASREQDMANLDVLGGWEWHTELSSRTCSSCLAQNGTVHAVDEPGPNDHQNGRCARSPITKSWRDLGFNLDEPRSLTPDARAWFDGQPEAVQLQIMGPSRLDLLQSGQVSWADLSTKRTTAGWRDSFSTTSVRDLTARAAA